MTNRVEYGKVEQLTGTEFDPVHWFLENIPFMIEQARSDGQRDAHSYRQFHVAGTGYAINTHDKISNIESAGNLKREPKSKVCVEKKLAGRMQKDMTNLVGLVILATTDKHQIKQVSDLPTPTLHLCGECRHEILEYGIASPSTLVVHSGLDVDINQTFTLGQEVDMYANAEDGDIDERLFRAQPNFKDWTARLQTYDRLTGGHETALTIDLSERQRLAQLALNIEVTIPQ